MASSRLDLLLPRSLFLKYAESNNEKEQNATVNEMLLVTKCSSVSEAEPIIAPEVCKTYVEAVFRTDASSMVTPPADGTLSAKQWMDEPSNEPVRKIINLNTFEVERELAPNSYLKTIFKEIVESVKIKGDEDLFGVCELSECGKHFGTDTSRGANKRYCSKKCKNKAQYLQRKEETQE